MARDKYQDQLLVGAAKNESDKVGPNMGRGTSGLKDKLGSAMAQTSMRLYTEQKAKEEAANKAKAKVKSKPAIQKLKDTSDQYWSPSTSDSGNYGSASGEIGADMGSMEKVGGYDPEKGMKKGGRVSSASKRADGCALRGKTRA
jgi:hypothetical protein